MHLATNLLVAGAVGAVAIVLFLGLANMWRGGDPNLSQRLMRWRCRAAILRHPDYHDGPLLPPAPVTFQIKEPRWSS